jgi:hypothetical protein
MSAYASKPDAGLMQQLILPALTAVRYEFDIYCRLPFLMVGDCTKPGESVEAVAALKTLAAKFMGVLEISNENGDFSISTPASNSEYECQVAENGDKADLVLLNSASEVQEKGMTVLKLTHRRALLLQVKEAEREDVEASEYMEERVVPALLTMRLRREAGGAYRVLLDVIDAAASLCVATETHFFLPSLAVVEPELADDFVEALLTSLYLSRKNDGKLLIKTSMDDAFEGWG